MKKRKYKKQKLPDNNKEEISVLNQDEAIFKPSIYMECLPNESLMLYGWQKFRGKAYRQFYGVGKVFRVVKGEKQDLVYIRFSVLPVMKPRLVVVYDNIPRRQTLTLKRGQSCQVWGICRNFTTEYTDLKTHEEHKKRVRMGLYATALNGWYVPTMIDIKRLPENEDLVQPSEKEKELQKTFEDVLNEFMTGKEDYEE